jgi:integrase/recombinase XerD
MFAVWHRRWDSPRRGILVFAVSESQRMKAGPARASDPDIAPDPLLLRFLDVIWMERGLAANTLAAYRADLFALQQWLAARGATLAIASRGDLLEYVAQRVGAGARPRSTARQLSAFRRFFRQQVRDGSRRDDPTADIAMPRTGRALPNH